MLVWRLFKSAVPLWCACGGASQASAHRACVSDSGWKVLVFSSGEKIALPGLTGVLLWHLPAPGSLCHGFLSCNSSSLYPQHLTELHFSLGLSIPGSAALPAHPPVLIGVFPRASQTHLLGGPVFCQVLSSHPGRQEPLGPTSGLQELIGRRSLQGSIRLLFGHTFPPCFL